MNGRKDPRIYEPLRIEPRDANKRLAGEYSDLLLNYSWDTYHTQTFRRTRRDVTNAARVWGDIMENKLHTERTFVAVERNRLDGIHLHALVRYNLFARADIRQLLIDTKSYCDKTFGFCAISEARSQESVNAYCAKYVTKDSGDYFFLGKGWDRLDTIDYTERVGK